VTALFTLNVTVLHLYR